ncbi:MAG: hypothetical protein ACTHOF_11490 [Flavisolibacter sp.]
MNESSLTDALPDIHDHVDAALTATTTLQAKFKEVHDEFVSSNPVSEE